MRKFYSLKKNESKALRLNKALFYAQKMNTHELYYSFYNVLVNSTCNIKECNTGDLHYFRNEFIIYVDYYLKIFDAALSSYYKDYNDYLLMNKIKELLY